MRWILRLSETQLSASRKRSHSDRCENGSLSHWIYRFFLLTISGGAGCGMHTMTTTLWFWWVFRERFRISHLEECDSSGFVSPNLKETSRFVHPGSPADLAVPQYGVFFTKMVGVETVFFQKKSLQLTSDDETSTVSFTFLLTLLSGNEKVYVSMVDPTKLNSSGDFLGREKCWPYRLCKSGQVVGMWDLLGNHDLKVIYPVSHDASMGGTVYLPTFLVDFYGKCREIYIIHGCYGYDILVNHSCFKLTFWPPEAWWHPKNWRIKGTVTNPEEVVSCTHLYPPWN